MHLQKNNQPLQMVSSYDPSFQVEPRLNQTHWQFFRTEKDIKLEIFSLCSQLELLCKKSYCKSDSMKNEICKLEFSNKFVPHACVELKKVNERFSLLPHKNATFKEYMLRHRMDVLFPKLWWYMQSINGTLKSPPPTLQNYFDRLSTLNQLHMMSHQIFTDIHSLVNHKYMAHQTALLYHAIADLGPISQRYKKDVEEIFGDIKGSLAAKKDQIPHLNNDEAQRLETMVRGLMSHSTFFADELSKPLLPIAKYFI